MLSALIRDSVSPWLPEALPLARLRRSDFSRKVAIDFEARDFRVKTIDTQAELKQVLSLRRSVFHYEFARKWISLRSDKDAFDDVADHLAIFDRRSGKIAGVYRLIPSSASKRFYSSTEFDLTAFLAKPGAKLELSRACIDKPYRNGVVISLLWRGIAEYARKAGTEHLFGLSSMSTIDVPTIALVSKYFQQIGVEDLTHSIIPHDKYRIDNYETLLQRVVDDPLAGGTQDVGALVPPLVKTYLRAGARVCSHPVIDRDFNCADWLTILNMQKLTAAYDRKYNKV